MIMIAGAVGWWYVGKINPEGRAGAVQSFTVAEDETSRRSRERLDDEGLVSDRGRLRVVRRTRGWTRDHARATTRSGPTITWATCSAACARRRARPTPGDLPGGVHAEPDGRRLDTEIERMSADDFIAASTDRRSVVYKPVGVTSLEGLLFPDTYQVSNAESEGQVIDRMIALMERVGGQEDIVTKVAALGGRPTRC